MKNTLETRLGLFAAFVIIAAVVILQVIGGLDLFKKSYRLHAHFKNVQDLKVGDQVKMAGVVVGKVESIGLTNNLVRVSMNFNQDTPVRTDSKATIKFTGLMGQNFVSVDFGTEKGVRAEPESYLETVEQADLSALMSKLDSVAGGVERLTKSFTGDEISNLLGPFTDFLKQNRESLSLSIGNLRTISDDIAQGKGTVGMLIKDDALHKTAMKTLQDFDATANEIQTAITEAKTIVSDARLAMSNIIAAVSNANNVVAQVNAGQGTLGRLVKDEKLYTETTDAMGNLKEIFQKINRGQGSVGKLVNDEALYKNAKLTLQKLDKATEGIEDQGPLNVLGIAVSTLF